MTCSGPLCELSNGERSEPCGPECQFSDAYRESTMTSQWHPRMGQPTRLQVVALMRDRTAAIIRLCDDPDTDRLWEFGNYVADQIAMIHQTLGLKDHQIIVEREQPRRPNQLPKVRVYAATRGF